MYWIQGFWKHLETVRMKRNVFASPTLFVNCCASSSKNVNVQTFLCLRTTSWARKEWTWANLCSGLQEYGRPVATCEANAFWWTASKFCVIVNVDQPPYLQWKWVVGFTFQQLYCLVHTNCTGAEWCHSRSGRFGGREISLFFDSSPSCVARSHVANHYCCSV